MQDFHPRVSPGKPRKRDPQIVLRRQNRETNRRFEELLAKKRLIVWSIGPAPECLLERVLPSSKKLFNLIALAKQNDTGIEFGKRRWTALHLPAHPNRGMGGGEIESLQKVEDFSEGLDGECIRIQKQRVIVVGCRQRGDLVQDREPGILDSDESVPAILRERIVGTDRDRQIRHVPSNASRRPDCFGPELAARRGVDDSFRRFRKHRRIYAMLTDQTRRDLPKAFGIFFALANVRRSPMENLAFIISQPRAGSSLLQRMLSVHPDIHTESESWILLRPLYWFRYNDDEAAYDPSVERRAVSEFFEGLPRGIDDWFEAAREMYGNLYRCRLQQTSGSIFLDKTPRYSTVLPEIRKLFPDAAYVILVRNPIAVLTSILSTWGTTIWDLPHYRRDLLTAPRMIADMIDHPPGRSAVIRYEHLVTDPERSIRKICSILRINYRSDMIDYGEGGIPRWSLGDPETVYRHTRPDPELADSWKSRLDSPVVWRLASEYLDHLGHDVVSRLGYDAGELENELACRRRSWLTLTRTVSFREAVSGRPRIRTRLLRFWERYRLPESTR